MASKILSNLKGCLASAVLGLNTLVCATAMVPFALLKLVLPFSAVRRVVDHVLNGLATGWIGVNGAWMSAVGHTRWNVQGVDQLSARGWYLVSSNHVSWVDIFALQKVFNRRIPMLKFFLKQQLIWVPVIGLAWWALDFPFLKRGGGKSNQVDLESTRRACERFKLVPTSVIIFLEGTRFTRRKHGAQASPYARLLKPKAGGMAIALTTMGSQFDALLDVTLHYPDGAPKFWDLMCGRVHNVTLHVQARPLPAQLLDADMQRRPRYRALVQKWIDGLWQEKDQLLGALSHPAQTAQEGSSA
jgi:1-acyl-sn-glycerol-3-phosphate acyltransferase